MEQLVEDLWNKREAQEIIKDEKGKKIAVKQYLMDNISKIYVDYNPNAIYIKFLYEKFGDPQTADSKDEKTLKRLESTAVYQALYEFQRKGVISLVKKLQKYNGAILADAVGLGKTWTALAVIKFYQMRGWEIIVLCPKRLERNWLSFKKDQGSIFEADKLEYFVRFHTDLNEKRLDTYTKERIDTLFQSNVSK
jgi:SNF2 family DNA or RNA helicase